MKAQRDPKTGKWLIQYRYTSWTGERKHSIKRGFQTKRDAEEWLRNFILRQQSSLSVTFADYVSNIYYPDAEKRVRIHTLINKKYVIEGKILPYFGKLKISSITAATVRKWENDLIQQGFAATTLRSIYNQLNCVLNHAVRYYGLKTNVCRQAGSMGKNKAPEKEIWGMEEFTKFADTIISKHDVWMAFNLLFYCGVRISELLALRLKDIDFQKKTIKIDESYQRLKKNDIFDDPKSANGFRIITMPGFLADDLQEYIKSLYGIDKDDRLFHFTKYKMESEMKRGIAASGVKKITLHCLRHSHGSYLVEELGATAPEVAARLGDTIATVLSTYVHPYKERQQDIADKLDAKHKEGL